MAKVIKDPYFETGEVRIKRMRNSRVMVNIPAGNKDYVIVRFSSLSTPNKGEPRNYEVINTTTRFRRKRGIVDYTYVKLSRAGWFAMAQIGLEFVRDVMMENNDG